MEYAKEIIEDDKPAIRLLEFAKTKLKKKGTILLAINNRLGVKYFVGSKSEYCTNIYDSINNKFKYGTMYSKKEIEALIQESKFRYRRYYYPLPDYKYANIIYTDKMLPDENDSKMNYNYVYNKDSLIVQDETTLLKQFIQAGNFKEYTNAYLIELSDYRIKNRTKYISYNNMRKDKYSLVLKIVDNKVEKFTKKKEAIEHLQNMKNNIQRLKELGFQLAEKNIENNENVIMGKLIKYPQLDKYIVSAIKKDEIDKALIAIDGWLEYIKRRIPIDSKGYVKDGFIDLVFENVFYDEQHRDYIFFDQEWYIPNVKMEFIIYRAINNLYKHNKDLDKYFPIERMNSRYNVCPNEEFERIEKELQEEIIDEEIRQFYSEQYKYLVTSEEIQKNIEDLRRFDRDNQELIREIQRLREELK